MPPILDTAVGEAKAEPDRALQCVKSLADEQTPVNVTLEGWQEGSTEGEKKEAEDLQKADEPHQRFWERSQGKPSTSSRGLGFFPLLSHPERVHLRSFTTMAGGPLVVPNPSGRNLPLNSDHRQDCDVWCSLKDSRSENMSPIFSWRTARRRELPRICETRMSSFFQFLLIRKPLEQTLAQNCLS